MEATPPSSIVRFKRWCLRRWYRLNALLPRRRKGVLLYVGMHKGREFDEIFKHYRVCYGIEANPELYEFLVEKYRAHPHVRLFNYAAAAASGPVVLNISSNQGASSSLGQFDEAWPKHSSGEITVVKSVTVPGKNLHEFCRDNQIDAIDDYISDIQGMDLEALKTLQPMIAGRQIKTITVETTRDGHRNIYRGLPDNSQMGFNALLGNHYRMVATGYGLLEDYWFADFEDGSWEIDCKWRRRRG